MIIQALRINENTNNQTRKKYDVKILPQYTRVLNKLLPISKGRIRPSCCPLQAWKARKEDPGCFSLTTASFRIFYILLFSK